MNKDIDILNRRFGEQLGFPDGHHPRFAWVRSEDMRWLFRPNPTQSFIVRTWADRIGRCWMLAQWRPTELTPAEWSLIFGCSRPYPGRGEYKAHPETALPHGVLPNAEMTARYIHSLRTQIETSLAEFEAQCWAEAQKEQDDAETRFYEDVADFEPLSWKLNSPWDPCTRGGPISVGGTKGLFSNEQHQ